MSQDVFREVVELLYGDGAEEIIAKRQAGMPEASDRKKRVVTAGLSAVGATAGAAGLGLAAHDIGHGMKDAKAANPSMKTFQALKTATKTRKLATGLVPLEIAGLGGELMATKILHGDTKKKVSKANPDGADLHVPTARGVLRQQAFKQAAKAAPKVKRTGGKLTAMANQKVKEITKSAEIVWEGEFSKVDADKRQVFGWASIVKKDGEDIVDLQGDYISIDEIEKSAYEYVVKSRKGGNQHLRNGEAPLHVSDMIESFLVTPEKIEKMGLPESTPLGWWVGYQINDDKTWQQVKSGERTGFSIHGRGVRKEIG
jgi:hypothetical protein